MAKTTAEEKKVAEETKPAAETKEVAVKEEAGVPVSLAEMYEADADAGFEEADGASYAIPFLRVLQAMSPQCKKSDGAYIKGAEEGMFINTVNNQLFDGVEDGVTVIPCHYRRKYIEWSGTLQEGGGYIREYDVAEGEAVLRKCTRDSDGNDRIEGGQHILVDVREHYCLLVKPDGSFEPILLSMGSTQIKKSKKWMSLMQGLKIGDHTAPMFSQKYHITTVPETKDSFSWFGLKIEHAGQVTEVRLYQAAKAFRDMVKSGTVRAAQDDIPF